MKLPKKIILLGSAGVMLLMLTLSNCKKEDQHCREKHETGPVANRSEDCFDFSEEDAINLTPHIMSKSTGFSEIADFSNSFLTLAEDSLPVVVDSLKPVDFCALQTHAVDMRTATGGSSCDNYISGVKICYGLNADHTKISMLYQAVYFCRNSYDATTHQGNYTVLNPSGNTFYKYNHSSGFVSATSADIAAIARYAENILLKHTPGSDPSEFDQSNANENIKDVEALYYSFQEIAALANDNASAYIKIYNAVRHVTVGSNIYNKHDLLLAPAKFNSSGTSAGSFLNRFANLSHLCPPSCNGDDFMLQ